jgi:hypothetical protein
MKRTPNIVFWSITVVLTVLFASPCLAANDEGGAELAGLVGHGTSGDANILGLGVGARLGYSAKARYYVGLSGLYHFGSHDDFEPEARHHSESFRGEVGYDVHVFPLVLRPSFRAGFTHVTTTRDVDGSFLSPDLGLGATLMVRLDGPFVGLDAEARMLTRLVNNGDNMYGIVGFGVYAVGGYRF